MSLLELKRPKTREKRLNALNAYLGDASPILKDIEDNNVKQRIRTFSQSTFDDIIYVLKTISTIRDSAIVIHGPAGCGSAQLNFNSNKESGRVVVTNLDQKDSIMGGDRKLRQAINKLYKTYEPKVIFVVSTPVVAINNDDIESVVIELREELGIHIIPIYSDGFKSRNGITGYDLALHGISKYLISKNEQGEKLDFANLISISENIQDLKEVRIILQNIGLKINLLPRFGNFQNISNASKAKFSISINSDHGDYIGRALEEEYKVPFLESKSPIGVQGTVSWIETIAKTAGLDKEAGEYINKAIKDLQPYLEQSRIDGIKVYINLPTLLAVGVAKLVEELGGEVVGITVDHIDDLHKKELEYIKSKNGKLQLHIASGQPFEEINLLNKIKPGLYISGFGKSALAAKYGIPVVSLNKISVLGFNGVVRFGHQVSKAIRNKNFINNINGSNDPVYQNSWLKKSANWYIKQEVK
ncbi:MAG: nitrogenase component 1 [Bacillota bacterium]|nr:nitrogenase component 1 [Bacillota bacterium]